MIRVLIVEDEPIAADAHAVYVDRVDGFTVVGKAGTAAEALQLLARGGIDLVLLDMVLPDQHGLQVVRAMRAAGHTADVIAVTSARDLAVVRAAVSQGIVQYLIKPFVFASLRDKLDSYRDYRRLLTRDEPVAAQHQVDHLLATLRGQDRQVLPKGLSRETFDAVAEALRGGEGKSASEVADLLRTSRITARRYLEHLADTGLASRHPRYRGSGRPEIEYRWRGED
ncbi:response regulator [Fodinicola acaciae]|uniref:response regulator n=1 Tax=Fodinicola acaciae TaxID=2681555 RepID=UPI0013D83D2A|nr:response regulator [Fodinicola acaciae]